VPIDPETIRPVTKPLAKGFTPDLLFDWALESAEAIDKANCRLFEARKLNTNLAGLTFSEEKPVYCLKPTNPVDSK